MSRKIETDDPLLSTGEVASTLGVTSETIRRWVKLGILTCERIGPFRRIHVRRSEVERQRALGHVGVGVAERASTWNVT